MNDSGSVSKKTRNKVEKVIKEMDYSPNNIARSLASRRSYLIGLMVPDIRNFFHSQASFEIDRLLKKHGYTTMLSNTSVDLEEKIKSLKLQKNQQVEGIITIGSVYNEEEFINEAIELNKTIPIVQLNNYNKNLVSVYCDERMGMYQSVYYLKNKGYKRPAFISTTKSKNNRAFKEKKNGFIYWLKKYYPKNEYIEISLVDKSLSEVMEFIKEYKIDSLQCENDSIAIRILKYMTEHKVLVPQDIGIIGFDNEVATNYTQKRISSIDHMISDHARVAVEAIIDLIDGKPVEQDNVIEPKLVLKETT